MASENGNISCILYNMIVDSGLPMIQISQRVGCTIEDFISLVTETNSSVPSLNLFAAICKECNANIIDKLSQVDEHGIKLMLKRSESEYRDYKQAKNRLYHLGLIR